MNFELGEDLGIMVFEEGEIMFMRIGPFYGGGELFGQDLPILVGDIVTDGISDYEVEAFVSHGEATFGLVKCIDSNDKNLIGRVGYLSRNYLNLKCWRSFIF